MPRVAPAVSLDAKTRATLNSWEQAPSTARALVLRCRIDRSSQLREPEDCLRSGDPTGHGGEMGRSFAALGLDGLRDAPLGGGRPSTMPRFGGKCRPWPVNSRNRKIHRCGPVPLVVGGVVRSRHQKQGQSHESDCGRAEPHADLYDRFVGGPDINSPTKRPNQIRLDVWRRPLPLQDPAVIRKTL
jgi:hypothetical protein